MSKNEMQKNDADKPTCFVIMPIADVHGYEPGHFGRVYEHLLKPAIESAGFKPIRADDTNKTDYIVVGIIQKIVESDMVLCDLSARNANVMYELGIRHAFNKPVALIKDKRTEKVFDIQGLRYTEYEEILRVDTVLKDTNRISIAVKETSSSDPKEMNSVVQLAGIRAAETPVGREISQDTQLILSALSSLEKRISTVERGRNPNKNELVPRYFTVIDGTLRLKSGEIVKIGETLYEAGTDRFGVLMDVDQDKDRIFLNAPSGEILEYSANSSNARNLARFPF